MKRSTWGELFDLDGEGPARPLEDAEAEALIAGALDDWAGSPSAGGPTAGKSAAWWATAAAVMLVAGAATAAMVLQGPDEDPSENATAPVAGERDEPSFPEPVEILDETDSETSMSPRPRRRARMLPERTPDDLLQEANRLRGDRRWGDAERTYLEVTSAYPGTHAAYVAQVAAANIRLERLNRPGPAARLFRAAIRSGGPLDPEARDGLARALRRTGDRSGERRALEGLLERHPRSAYANRARERLTELEAAASR